MRYQRRSRGSVGTIRHTPLRLASASHHIIYPPDEMWQAIPVASNKVALIYRGSYNIIVVAVTLDRQNMGRSVQLTVRFYFAQDGTKLVLMFPEDLQQKEPILHKLVVAGIKKIERSEYHGPPLTEMVDRDHGILELRVGSANIARVFFFFRPGQEIILTNGYVKKQQEVDIAELKKARIYKQDWEGRFP